MSNHRTDAYGGSPQNRLRLPIRVVAAVRDAVGRSCRCSFACPRSPSSACRRSITGLSSRRCDLPWPAVGAE
ncbi:MAG: hypothetical protein ACRDQZ_26885 [Mycobacteriales bacterium]